MKIIHLTYLFFLFLITVPFHAECKYYQYVDEKGVKHFTEDKGLIPDNSLDDTIEYKDRYDYMSEEEIAAAKKKEVIEAEKQKILRQAALKRYRKKAALQEAKAALQEKLKKIKKSRTKVIISNNQILVPVTLEYKGNTVTTTLLLDTGATSTVINDSVAAQLNIDSGKAGLARVAGGGIIKTKQIKVAAIKVGPKSLSDKTIFVMDHQGPAQRHNGLLGLDFIRYFNHTIDYKKQYIDWKE